MSAISSSQSARTTSMGACASCGTYGGPRCDSSCQPGRRLELGQMRRAARDSRLSPRVVEQQRLQDDLVRDL